MPRRSILSAADVLCLNSKMRYAQAMSGCKAHGNSGILTSILYLLRNSPDVSWPTTCHLAYRIEEMQYAMRN
jgi:hypothetical protein